MDCPTCGASSRVIESRPGAHLTVRRRHACNSCALRFTTVEVHQAVFSATKPRLQRYERTVRTRIQMFHRDIEIAKNLHIGAQVLADMHKIGKSAVHLAAKRGRGYLRRMRK